MTARRLCLALGLVALVACGGKDDAKKTPTHTGPSGLRIHLVAGSTTTAAVYGGPEPTDAWAVALSPTTHGYTSLGPIGGAGPTTVDFTTPYPYFLILVKYGAVSASDPMVRIDAIQRIPDGMYMTGMTNSSFAFYSTGTYNEDRLFLPALGDPYWLGAPDGKAHYVYAWALLPSGDWAQ